MPLRGTYADSAGVAAAAKSTQRPRSGERRLSSAAHRGDQPVDPVVDGYERVLAQDRPLRLVVQLQMHPVDRVVVAALLGGADEVAAQLGSRGLGRNRLRPEGRR